jgi:hypothetical protein
MISQAAGLCSVAASLARAVSGSRVGIARRDLLIAVRGSRLAGLLKILLLALRYLNSDRSAVARLWPSPSLGAGACRAVMTWSRVISRRRMLARPFPQDRQGVLEVVLPGVLGFRLVAAVPVSQDTGPGQDIGSDAVGQVGDAPPQPLLRPVLAVVDEHAEFAENFQRPGDVAVVAGQPGDAAGLVGRSSGLVGGHDRFQSVGDRVADVVGPALALGEPLGGDCEGAQPGGAGLLFS